MYTLFIDTHSDSIMISFVKKNQVFTKTIKSERSHSVLFLPMLNEMMKEKNIEFKKIETIIVVNGPGSFTGIRIGLSVAKTMAYALNIKIYTISSLKCFLVSNETSEDKMSVIEDGKGYYICAFDKNNNEILKERYVTNILDYQYPQVDKKMDINKIIQYVTKSNPVNVHELKANYVKKIEVEK